MNFPLYTGINLFCIITIVVILISDYNIRDKTPSGVALRRLFYVGIVLFMTDLIWGLDMSGVEPLSGDLLWIIDSIYYMMIYIVGIFWIYYIAEVIDEPIRNNKNVKLSLYIFTAIMILLVVASRWTGWMECLEYGEDEFNWLILVGFTFILILPLLLMTAHVLYKIFRTDVRAYRREYITALIFIVPVVVCDVINVFLITVPIFSLGLILGIIIVYYNTQNQKITLDSLTQINNSTQAELYFKEVSKSGCLDGNHLYFAVMDLDHFRLINNTYGRMEGDRALKDVARILKVVAGNKDCFIARYGGDEFIMISVDRSRDAIESICDKIRELAADASKERQYDIGISIGVAEMKDGMTFIQMFDAADSIMFKVKEERRKRESSV